MRLTDKLFSFQGRLRRRDWWIFQIVLAAVNVTVWLILATVNGASLVPFMLKHSTSAWALVSHLIFLFPRIAVDVKRLHDRDLSGWWLLGFYPIAEARRFLPIFGVSIDPIPGIILIIGAGLYGLWLLYQLGICDADDRAGRFGPPPKGVAENPADVFE